MATLHWGICSAGKICWDFAENLTRLSHKEHQVVAVGARSKDSAKEFAEIFSIPKHYGSYQELADDSTIDVVYIGVINPEHCRLSKMMLNAGKHVLCEKPAAMNSKQLEEILECAKVNERFFMEGLWSRCFPAYQHIRSEVENNRLGDIKVVMASFGKNAVHVPRLVEKELGGGVILDLAIYAIQFATMIYKEKPEKIIAQGFVHSTGVDETVSITLLYSNNRMAQLTSSMRVDLSNQASVHGTEGSIHLPEHFWCPDQVIVKGEKLLFPLPHPDVQFNFFNSGGLTYEANAVHDCITRGEMECPLASHDDSRLVTFIMDEARKQLGVVYDVDKPGN